MTKSGIQFFFLIIFFLAAVFGSEYDNEKPPNYEYIQIFKNIPTLFEYLLDMLEERPEILERDDVTVFTKRNSDNGPDNNRDERETNGNNGIPIDSTVQRDFENNAMAESTTIYSDKDNDNYNTGIETKTTTDNIFENNNLGTEIESHIPIAATNIPIINEHIISNPIISEVIGTTDSNDRDVTNENVLNDLTTSSSINERSINSDSTEKQYSTVLHEYGSSIQNAKRNVIDHKTGGFNENKKSAKTKSLGNGGKNKKNNKHDKDDVEKEAPKKNERRAVDMKSFGGSFLTPEEIEDQMIKVDQMLEEHNKNRKK